MNDQKSQFWQIILPNNWKFGSEWPNNTIWTLKNQNLIWITKNQNVDLKLFFFLIIQTKMLTKKMPYYWSEEWSRCKNSHLEKW